MAVRFVLSGTMHTHTLARKRTIFFSRFSRKVVYPCVEIHTYPNRAHISLLQITAMLRSPGGRCAVWLIVLQAAKWSLADWGAYICCVRILAYMRYEGGLWTYTDGSRIVTFGLDNGVASVSLSLLCIELDGPKTDVTFVIFAINHCCSCPPNYRYPFRL